MEDHYFIPYPDSHAKIGSCVRCGRLPNVHPSVEKDLEVITAAADFSATILDMDYTDSIANATGALMSALSQVVEACIDLPPMADWRDSDQWYDLVRVRASIQALTEDDRNVDPVATIGVLEMNINRARMAKHG